MHILHITNSYGGTAVYKNLYMALDDLGIRQTIYVPLNSRNRDRVGKQMIDFKTKESIIIYSTVLKWYHRFLYRLKIKLLYKDVQKKVRLDEISFVHASTQCLDGAIAYELKQHYKIPFLIAVRNTDLNTYYRFFRYHIGYFEKILHAAEHIVFISPKYLEIYRKKYITSQWGNEFATKANVIPNGIGPYFLENRNYSNRAIHNPVRIIFVSAFLKAKGIIETINAIELLNRKGYHICLNAVGRGLPGRNKERDFIRQLEELERKYPWLTLEDYKSPEAICKQMRQSDIFVMPSKPETFGLVYVEALSQNLPIVYTKGEGFDGFFPEGEVGYSAISGNVASIAEVIMKVIHNYPIIVNNITRLSLEKDFSWPLIATKYMKLYKMLQR